MLSLLILLLCHYVCVSTLFRFQDAASYMSAAADAMDAAREEIFITDWWCVNQNIRD